jgi:hypothetical protein
VIIKVAGSSLSGRATGPRCQRVPHEEVRFEPLDERVHEGTRMEDDCARRLRTSKRTRDQVRGEC